MTSTAPMLFSANNEEELEIDIGLGSAGTGRSAYNSYHSNKSSHRETLEIGRVQRSTAPILSTRVSIICSLLALHGSIGVWVGIWDSFVYTGFGRLWCQTPEPLDQNVCSDQGNEFRNFVWVVLGALLAFSTDSLLCNGNVEAPALHEGIKNYWIDRSKRSRLWTYLWTALAYIAQVMMTCGMYELFDNEAVHATRMSSWSSRASSATTASLFGTSICLARAALRSSPINVRAKRR